MFGLLLYPAMAVPLFISTFDDDPPRKPSALVALEESRRRIVSGRIEWSVEQPDNEASPISLVSRFARNGDWIFENRGDRLGWTSYDPSSLKGNSKYPRLCMANGDGVWFHQETSLGALWWSGIEEPQGWVADQIKDVRGVGLWPSSGNMEDEISAATLGKNLPQAEFVSWDQRKEDDKYLVTARYSNGARIEWTIDPGKGWNAERVTFSNESEPQFEAVSTLRKYGDTWLPETTTYYRGGAVTEIVRLDRVSINQRTDAASFNGNDLGMEPGTNIAAQNLPTEVGKPRVWNGDAVSSWDDWIEDVRKGKRQWGPTFQRVNRGEKPRSPYSLKNDEAESRLSERNVRLSTSLAEHEGLWLRYVRDFVRRYKLNEDQSAKAMQILAECQETADAIVKRKEPAMTKLLDELDAARKSGDHAAMKRVSSKLDEIREPINRIFDEQLKPRLEKLPTRAQRAAVQEDDPQP